LCATEAHASLPSRVTSGRLAATSGGRSLGRSRVSIGEVSLWCAAKSVPLYRRTYSVSDMGVGGVSYLGLLGGWA
jgi:hypothetical protein